MYKIQTILLHLRLLFFLLLQVLSKVSPSYIKELLCYIASFLYYLPARISVGLFFCLILSVCLFVCVPICPIDAVCPCSKELKRKMPELKYLQSWLIESPQPERKTKTLKTPMVLILEDISEHVSHV